MSRRFATGPAELPWWIAIAGFASMYLPVYWWAVFGMVDAERAANGHLAKRRARARRADPARHDLAVLGLANAHQRGTDAPGTRVGLAALRHRLLLYVVGQVVGISIFMFGSQPFVVAGVLLLLRGPTRSASPGFRSSISSS
jgi:hypothetical protein